VLFVQLSTGITLLNILLGIIPKEKVDMEIVKPYLKKMSITIDGRQEIMAIKALFKQAEDIIKKKQKGEGEER